MEEDEGIHHEETPGIIYLTCSPPPPPRMNNLLELLLRELEIDLRKSREASKGDGHRIGGIGDMNIQRFAQNLA